MGQKFSLNELISLSEAAKRVNLNPIFLRQLCVKNRLRARKIGRNWVTTMKWVREYLDSRSEKNIPKKYRNRN